MACGTSLDERKECQDIGDWSSYSLNYLRSKVEFSEADIARVYTVASTRFNDVDRVIDHLGTGPNLEGGVATLCTCKRSMRHAKTADYWKGKWIIGVASRAKSKGFDTENSHYLFYMMKVKQAFDSFDSLYDYMSIEYPEALEVKKATENQLGDIYVPKERYGTVKKVTGILDPRAYYKPCKNHDHEGEWGADITNPPLLLGDPKFTFVWKRPKVLYKEPRGTGNKEFTMSELMSDRYLESIE